MVISQTQVTDGMSIDRIGGKAAGLGRLLRAGATVPPFFVIPPDVDLDDAADTVLAAWKSLGGGAVAVRSSAIAEDGATASFAGQLESYLGIDSEADLLDAIRRCRASAQSDRVKAYCDARGIEPGPVAVIVQRMIVGDRSGVLFSRNPENPGQTLISGAWGLGEGVVQGAVPCDTFQVEHDGSVVASLDDKTTHYALVDGEPLEVPTDPAKQHTAVLSDDQARALAAWGRALEETLGCPQDIEWTFDDQLYLLQTRPITTPVPWGRRMLWDNSNIVESYNGVTTPLTYSFARNAYAIVYTLFCGVMGVDQETLAANAMTFRRMIGLIHGRVYYNLNAWYRVITLLPGYAFNRGFMEQMMGVSEAADDEDAGLEDADWQEQLRALPRLVRMFAMLGWRLSRWDAESTRFRVLFDEVYGEYRGRDLDRMTPHELVEATAVLEQKLLWAWTPPIVNDFFTMIFHGVLKSLSAKWLGDAEIANDLLAGDGALESTEPTRALLAQAEVIRKNPTLLAAVMSEGDERTVMARLRAIPAFESWFSSYMARYGDRCVDELKLETVPLRDRPGFVISTLRNYLSSPPMDPSSFGAAERSRREAAEQDAMGKLTPLRRFFFRRILSNARYGVRTREGLRFLRTRIFGLARDIFRAMGDRMVDAGAIDVCEDIFYLHTDEVFAWVDGTGISTDLRPIIAARRAEFAHFRELPAPSERFHTYGPVHRNNKFKGETPPAVAEDGVYQGTPCYPGIVEGTVVVRTDPGDGVSLQGQILVAPRTDPGWVPLFPSVSALIVERGSLLSHSAVVAREMGIPTIVGVRGITQTLQDGMRVRMDCTAGTIEVLDEAR